MTESGKIGDVGDETQILKITDENRPQISNVHIVHHAYHNNNQRMTMTNFFPSVGHFEEKIPSQNPTTDLGGGLSSIQCIQWSELDKYWKPLR